MRIASFDIGKKNFAFYVEEMDLDELEDLKKIYKGLDKIHQRRIKGHMNVHIANILDKLFKNGKRIEMGVFDIRHDKTSNDLDLQTRVNMHTLLKKHEHLWDSCQIIVIEQQYFNVQSGGRKSNSAQKGANVDALKLAECCLNWFLDKYYPFKEICYFGAIFKTQMLGAPDSMTKPQRKKWSILKATEIFTTRNDIEAIDQMKSSRTFDGKKQKSDDVCDCLIMTQAYKYRNFVMG